MVKINKGVALAASLGVVVTSLGGSPVQAKSQGDISGFFIAAENNDSSNEKILKDIKNHGGNTVVTFGYTLEKSAKKDTYSGLFANCKVGSVKCVDKVKSGLSVRNYLVYKGNTKFGSNDLKCSREVIGKSGSRSYAFFAIPTSGTCTSAKTFDIVATTASGTDKAKSVSKAASKLGMSHYVGMPAPSKDKKQAWLPDASYLGTMNAFTQMFVKANSEKGVGGYYQHREMPMSTNSSWNGMVSLYKTQNSAVAKKAPSKLRNVIISPYLDTRKVMKQGPVQAGDAAKKLAGTKGKLNSLVIAPQDGMGTGKGSAYAGKQWAGRVDPFARTVVGDVKNPQAYYANTGTYYKSMKAGIKSSKNVHLWSNIESMAPIIKSGANKNVCSTGHNASRGFSWKSRLIAQVTAAKPHVEKQISYHWDYMNCSRNGSPAMKEELKNIKG